MRWNIPVALYQLQPDQSYQVQFQRTVSKTLLDFWRFHACLAVTPPLLDLSVGNNHYIGPLKDFDQYYFDVSEKEVFKEAGVDADGEKIGSVEKKLIIKKIYYLCF